VTEEQIRCRIAELAQQVAADFRAEQDEGELLLVGVLKGAVMFMTDFARALPIPVQLEFMAVSSYGSATSSSGVVRILKGLDRDIADRNVLVVEDIIDSGLTLSWLLRNLAIQVNVPVRYIGFDIPQEFVVGYGLDYGERYRDLPYIGTLAPEVYAD
jgi:hypoxanthine phosphoribosyltransferase